MPNPVPNRTFYRRTVLTAGATAGIAAAASGCTFFSTDPDAGGQAGGGAAGSDAMESPMLTEMVDAGELPPLEERLPTEPLVVEAAEPGDFGGTWRSVTLGPGDHPSIDRIIGYEPGLRRNPMLDEVGPGVFTAVEANEDGTQFTISVREGIKWSDGEPFTADDVVFSLEDVFGNTELHPSPPDWLSSGEEKAVAEKVDDVTLTVTFAEPTGRFLNECDRSVELTRYPMHYAKDFLPAYNDDIDAKVEDAGLEAWPDLWADQIGAEASWKNPELPSLSGWIVSTPLGAGSSVEFTRNPYYWKTDADGRQLPYIDTLSFEIVTDEEVIALKTSDGELDMLYRHANTDTNRPVFTESAEAAETRIVHPSTTDSNAMCLALNLAHKDPEKQSLYQNKDFRVGLSHAINRDELISAVWERQGEPWQCAPHADSIYYDEEFAKQYTEFDIELANEHLDAAGLTETDSDGFRTLPGGGTLTVILDVATALRPQWPVAASIVSDMWAEVGVRTSVNTVDRTLFYDRKLSAANEHDASVWGGDAGLAVEAADPRWYMPFSDESVWATPWGAYYNTGGEGGEEPVPAAREQIELMWQHASTPDPDEQEEIFRQVLDIAKQEFWAIGIVTAPNPFWVVKDRIHNVIEGVPDTYVYRTPGHANPETWFIRENA